MATSGDATPIMVALAAILPGATGDGDVTGATAIDAAGTIATADSAASRTREGSCSVGGTGSSAAS